MDPDSVTRLSQSPVVVWAVVIVMFLVMVASAVPRILGPVGTGLADWAEKRRKARETRIGADVMDMRRAAEHLESELDEERSEFAAHRRVWAAREERWRREWHAHRLWDYRAQEALRDRDPPFELAPPFMTPDPDEEAPP